ncbi:ComEC/Rec2 family competence protein [Acidocella sp.]|jgi:competence protein ComEC|uniref:ComEC/Rec2 family competence protein n=1 Tax=Acidocella sp. TaxID=50710 RepID=UPI002F426E93
MRAWFAAWVEAEHGRFPLLLPVAMGAAILAYFVLPHEPRLWLGLCAAAGALAALVALWRFPPGRLAAALALAAALGFARAEWRTAAEPGFVPVPHGVTDISGTIAGIDLLPNGRRITLARPSLNGGPALRRTIRVHLRDTDDTPLTLGEGAKTRAFLFGPERPAYPGGWDQGRQDFFQGLDASGFAIAPVTVIAPAQPGTLARRLLALRQGIATRILATLPIDTGSIAVTLLTGEEQTIPPPEREAFIAAGLAHILAVAGLHVGIVMGLAFAATRFLLTRFERTALHWPAKSLAAMAALGAGVVYALLTGAHLPILRSLAMASLVTLGIIVGRRAISLRGLSLAAMVIMLTTPEAVIGTSFQMSFSAVLALIAGYAAAQGFSARKHRDKTVFGRVAGHLIALAFTSLLAGGASMPYAAYQFQQIQPYWIPANLVAVPLTALWILPLGLAALALMPLHLAALALVPMGWGIAVIIWITARIAAWPAAMLRIAPIPDAAILLVTAGLIWLCIWRSAARYAGLPLLLAGALVYAAIRPPDVLVSADARLIALRDGAGILLVRQPKATSYTLAQWAPVWGGAQPVLSHCTAESCRVGRVLLAMAPPAGGCGDAMLVVSPEPLRGVCEGLPVIDRFSVWRQGAMEAWVGAHGVRLRSDRMVQGERPWVPPYPPDKNLR